MPSSVDNLLYPGALVKAITEHFIEIRFPIAVIVDEPCNSQSAEYKNLITPDTNGLRLIKSRRYSPPLDLIVRTPES